MATNVMEKAQHNDNGFFVKWGWVTALLGALTTILAAHSMIFFVLTAAVGLVTGIGQWWLLRDTMRGAWQWVLASALGWIIGYGLVAYTFLAQSIFDGVSVNWVRLLIVIAYALIFGLMGLLQSVVLHRRGHKAIPWIVTSAISGAVLGVVLQVTCGLGGGNLLILSILADVSTPGAAVCVEIGAVMPRLQSYEPLFNVMPLSYAAHLIGWIAYATTTAFGWKFILGNK